MATPAHCIYCFESLYSSLQGSEPPILRVIEKLWEQYNMAKLEGEQYDEREDDEDGPNEMETDGESDLTEDPPPPTSLRAPTINRLIAPSPSSGSSSSTPSLVSTSSSSRDLASASSKSSSNSSFFSFGRSTRSLRPPPRSAEDDRPLFVTWNTVSRSGNRTLRGCIGTFEAQELSEGLRSYALTSAFDDSRFPPIAKRELPSLEVGVTLLTDFEPAPTPLSWDLGTHGLRISFTYHSRRYGATYLPFVPIDQGWTKEETLISLMRKAGWIGRKEEWRKVGDLKVVRYQGRKVSVGYEEWREWRDWCDGTDAC
ncbi:MAG: hypothetical protein M1835_005238 [Candelina submexicana]|nr:MAG: hypothetical protein M1835_005238 [Candelina submexicana]